MQILHRVLVEFVKQLVGGTEFKSTFNEWKTDLRIYYFDIKVFTHHHQGHVFAGSLTFISDFAVETLFLRRYFAFNDTL